MFIAQVDYTTNRTIAITLDSLGAGNTATSSTIDNTVDLFITADIQFVIETGSEGTGNFVVKLLRSADGGSTFDGQDDPDVNNELLVGVFHLPDGEEGGSEVFSLDTTRAGTLPQYWRILFYNNSDVELAASGNSVKFTGKKMEIV